MIDEVLQFAVENGMINLSYVQEQMEMNKREELLKKHKWAISQGKDGYWRTYLPDGENGRKMIKKSSQKDIEDSVIDYLKIELENPTVEEAFNEYNDRRYSLGQISNGTHYRNKQTFKRHYSDGMGSRHIKNISPEEWQDFFEEEISKKELKAKAFANLRTVTKGFLKRAKKRKLITFNVTELFQELDTTEASFKRVVKTDEEEVFSEEDFPKVIDYVLKNPDVKNLGILIMFVTGVRVGELVAIKQSDIDGNIISIRREEVRIRKEDDSGSDYVIREFPKTEAGIRKAIIPNDYLWIIKKIRAKNPFGEYLMTVNSRRIHTTSIRSRMRTMCKNLDIYPKSPHKARKTYGSILLDNNIDNRLITSVMGHTDIACTENHYHRNRRKLDRKVEILSKIPDLSMDIGKIKRCN